MSRGTQDPSRSRHPFAYRAVTFYGGPFQAASTRVRFVTPYGTSYNPGVQAHRFRLFPVRSPLLGESRLISPPRATEMFQFTRFPPYGYEFTLRYLAITPGGLPHSEIPGSAPACGSPRLIAAYHVLHRLLAPRHPPYALCSLITLSSAVGLAANVTHVSPFGDPSTARPYGRR